MKKPDELLVKSKDWEATPLVVQTVVVMLWHEKQVMAEQIKQLQQQMTELQTEIERLQERVGKNSQNSSKPPSSDPPDMQAKPSRDQKGRKAGGQPGHRGQGRKLKPLECVDHVIIQKPTECKECGALLMGADVQPRRHQVIEVPRVKPEVTEYQLHTLTCLACGCQNKTEWPSNMPSGSFGPRTQATLGYLSGRFGISKRDIQEIMGTIFRTDISLGSVPAQESCLSTVLEKPVGEVYAYVQKQPTINLDETSWHELNKKIWLWVGSTSQVTAFRLFKTRGSKGAKQLLGTNYEGIVGSDRYSAYNWIDPEKRQICWAHLKRDFQALVDRGGESKTIGRLLLAEIRQFFNLWHRIRDGTLSRSDFQVAMQLVQKDVHCLLQIGTHVEHQKTRKTCKNILKVEPALWTFVMQDGVEPTNNAAERALRRGVIWRRRSFGTQSAQGSRFVERILTVVISLRQQNRDVLDFLTYACTPGQPVPSLLPGTN
jgi:transposase